MASLHLPAQPAAGAELTVAAECAPVHNKPDILVDSFMANIDPGFIAACLLTRASNKTSVVAVRNFLAELDNAAFRPISTQLFFYIESGFLGAALSTS
jgi:hypothetical protein